VTSTGDALEGYFTALREVNDLVVRVARSDGEVADHLRLELEAARERRGTALAALRDADPR
jgi:hypothetical protein